MWLTAEGTAKIGDFGLAVNLGRSRLTQHGLMVGTVAYMPPEQALGGEVTPQSDLYSLGAMLYELVTGKPPFQADDPTAVISQHINIAPVAPSWNTAHCPPDLESLILQLLAKVPNDRPASAAEVLAALERVDPEAKSASHSDSQANPLDRLARGVFVGRERELERLRGAFDNAFAGHGSVLMLVGEPGIGKTRVAQEAETYARMRGAQVLWGRAHEAAGAPPYFPWVQAARAYRAQNSDEVRRREWGPYAEEGQRILPALRELFPNLAPLPETESEEGQFRLFDALSGFLRDVSERVPLLIVLDDLHWADRPTLLMLTHLAREIGHSRVLLIGTYWDTDLDRTHPLSAALAELNREQLFTRIPLRGLTREDVAAYIAAVAHVDPAPALVARIHEETEGNAFFLGEVVNLMAEEGTLANASTAEIAIPEGVKEALGRRLDRLGAEANELLSVASVIGRECSHELLAMVTEFDDDALLGLVEEALRARVLEETGVPGEYRFTHALMQDALYDELSTARRVRMHAHVAETLERLWAGDLDTHAPELARHFAEAAVMNRPLAVKAADYAERAAGRAEATLAWDEAVRWYRQALASLEDTGANTVHRADLEIGLATALRVAGDRVAGWQAFDRAVDLYRVAGDGRAFAAGVVRGRLGGTYLGEIIARYEVFREALAGIGDTPSSDACVLLATLAVLDLSAAGDAHAERARSMAVALALPDGEWSDLLANRDVLSTWETSDYEGAASIGDRMGPATSFGRNGAAFGNAAFGLLEAGEVARGQERFERSLQASIAQRSINNTERDLAVIASIAAARHDFGRFSSLLGDRRTFYPALVRTLDALRRTTGDEARGLLPAVDAPGRALGDPLLAPVTARIALATGHRGDAQRALEEWWAGRSTARLISGSRRVLVGQVLLWAPVLLAVGAREMLETSYQRLRERPWQRLGGGIIAKESADVVRGALALRLDDVDAAEQHFAEGLAWASRPDVGFILVQGECHQGLAEVAEARGDHALAMEHLDAAGELFAQYGAKPYLDQVLAKKQFLKA